MYNVDVTVTSPVFTNKQLSVEVNVSGIPGPAGSVNQNFDAGSLDITSLTTINESLASSIPANSLRASVALTSSNATESISNLTNMPANQPIRYYPASGLKVTFVYGTGSNNPRCSSGINVEINGTTKEWIEFTKINGVVLQTNVGIYSL